MLLCCMILAFGQIHMYVSITYGLTCGLHHRLSMKLAVGEMINTEGSSPISMELAKTTILTQNSAHVCGHCGIPRHQLLR